MPYSLDDLDRIAANSEYVGISCSSEEDKTRQEFKEECDVNHILRMHGYNMRPVQFGVHNFDDDLTAQMQSRSLFEAWYAEAPAEVRELYADFGAFLRAVGSGAFVKASEAAEVPSAASEASASPEGARQVST